MKKVFFFFVVLFSSFALEAQRNDGVARPTRGAFWDQGCDGSISKYVENNLGPGTYSVECGGISYSIVVEQMWDKDTKILFRDGNFSERNRNWVTIYGKKIWRYSNSNDWTLADCGNRIYDISRGPKDLQGGGLVVTGIDGCNCPEEPKVKDYQFEMAPLRGTNTSMYYFPPQTQQPMYAFDQNAFLPKQKTWFGRNWGWFVPLLAIGIGTGTYFLIDTLNSNHSSSNPPPDDGDGDETWSPNDSGSERGKVYNVPAPSRGFVIPIFH